VPLIQHGAHGLAEGAPGEGGVALVAECGQHFQRATAELATQVALDFLAHFGLVEREPPPGARGAAQTRVALLRTVVVRTSEFRFARPVVGFETFDEGELIATDGDEEIRAPCPRCTILMPARQPVPGREGVYLARPL
jgi:succinylglutamate desuccinylase